jgi:hypothetical protein
VDGGGSDLRSASQFPTRRWRKYGLPSDSVNCTFIPAALRPSWPGDVSISYGVYDQPWGGQAMNPSILATTLANALARSDRYVWFYVEGSSYLLPEAQGGASQSWVDAVRSALPATPAPDPSPTPTPPPPTPAVATPIAAGEARSSCGLLGIEIVPLFLILSRSRRRNQKKDSGT